MVEYPRKVVWYVECRPWSGTTGKPGPAPIEAQMGSAVVVELQQVDKKELPRKYLLTCAHVVRGTASTGRDPERKKGWGPLLGEIQCFEPGKGYSPTTENNRRSGDVVGFSLATIHLSPFGKQEGDVPDEARLDSNDWVLLDVTNPDFQAMPAVLRWGPAENEREPRIIGFPGGAYKWKRNQLVQSVETDPFRLNRTPESGMLKLDGLESREGMSGGGIFDSGGLLVGIHRSATDISMERGGISAEHIRQRLEVQGWRPVESATAYTEKEDPDLGGELSINRKLLRDAESPRGTRLFIDVPRTPPHFDGRDDLLQKVIRSLKAGHDLAITGLPGVGKTTFAAALARHKETLRHFRDGILWGSVGPSGDYDRVLVAWAAALGFPIGRSAQNEELPKRIQEAIGSRSVLIIIDDVWQLGAVKRLRVAGPNCVILLSTRDLGIARSFAGNENVFEVPLLNEDAAFALFRRLAAEACATDENRARAIVKGTSGLPLALELIGGFLAAPENSSFRELAESALGQITDVGQRLQLAFSRLGAVDQRDITLQQTIVLSLTGLPQPAIDAFYRLGVFESAPATFSLDAAKTVAGVDARHLALLVARHLLESAGDDRLELHQVLADAARVEGISDRRACQLRHSRYYGTLASAALREYARNNEGRTPGAGTAAYRRERQQIDAAVAWLMSQQPSNETDDVLVDIAQVRHFMPTVAIYEDSEQAQVRSVASYRCRRSHRKAGR